MTRVETNPHAIPESAILGHGGASPETPVRRIAGADGDLLRSESLETPSPVLDGARRRVHVPGHAFLSRAPLAGSGSTATDGSLPRAASGPREWNGSISGPMARERHREIPV